MPLTRGGHRVDLLAMTAEQIAKHLPTRQATPISLGWCPAKVVSAVARCSRRTARASPGHGPGRREPRRLPQVQQAPGFRPMHSFSPSHLDVVGYPEVARRSVAAAALVSDARCGSLPARTRLESTMDTRGYGFRR